MRTLTFEHVDLAAWEKFMKDIGATNVYGVREKNHRGVEHIEFAVGGERYMLPGYSLQIQVEDEEVSRSDSSPGGKRGQD